MRQDMLKQIHAGHQGISKCRLRAGQAVWWPSIGTDIAQYVKMCDHCQQKQSAQKAEPLISSPLPERPWQRVACDLADVKGKQFIVLVDCYSKWIEVHHLHKTTSLTIINYLKGTFARYGIPEVVVTDNGPQFLSEFKEFSKEYDFTHITSSPHYPQANGQAEKAVHIAKMILRQTDPVLALMTYRSTPIPALGVSPSRLMMGREMRTTLPILPHNLRPKIASYKKLQKADKLYKSKTESYFNQTHGAKQLDELKPGDNVRIRTKSGWSNVGEVMRKAGPPRSYIIRVDGAEYRRNRRHILHVPKPLEPVLDELMPHDCNPKDSQQTRTRPHRSMNTPAWHKDYVMQ